GVGRQVLDEGDPELARGGRRRRRGAGGRTGRGGRRAGAGGGADRHHREGGERSSSEVGFQDCPRAVLVWIELGSLEMREEVVSAGLEAGALAAFEGRASPSRSAPWDGVATRRGDRR